MIKLMSRLFAAKVGATTIEYGFIVAFVVIAIIVAIQQLGSGTLTLWQSTADRVSVVVN